MSKRRKCDLDEKDDDKMQEMYISNKKHTLDSDEEDSDDYERGGLCESDIEGEEDGISKVREEVKFTPFNMREELEEGHFDVDGHYHWNKSDDIKDNWLDNIDWVKIEKEKECLNNECADDPVAIKSIDIFNESLMYKQLLSYMIEGETVGDSLRRFGKSRKRMSSIERLRLKKLGITDDNEEKITKLTELANEILTKTGNMDIYQATFEYIKEKVGNTPSTSKGCTAISNPSFDMYSDDFNEKEIKLKGKSTENTREESKSKELLWEFKWQEKDTSVQGPFNTNQMLKWSRDGYFKSGVYVRKVGELTNFYSSNRIDFDLYL